MLLPGKAVSSSFDIDAEKPFRGITYCSWVIGIVQFTSSATAAASQFAHDSITTS
jgi:hypothetical protein